MKFWLFSLTTFSLPSHAHVLFILSSGTEQPCTHSIHGYRKVILSRWRWSLPMLNQPYFICLVQWQTHYSFAATWGLTACILVFSAYKAEYVHVLWWKHSILLSIYPEKSKHIYTNIYVQIFSAALQIIALNRKQVKDSSIGKLTNK